MAEHDGSTPHAAGAFDIRTFIASLIGVYGIVLVLTGLLGTGDDELERADGFNVNLWAGVGMVIFAVAFVVWARLRPVVVPDSTQPREPTGQAESGHDRTDKS